MKQVGWLMRRSACEAFEKQEQLTPAQAYADVFLGVVHLNLMGTNARRTGVKPGKGRLQNV
ncbi:MAG: hypothetical protein HXY41_15045 [Chloroflexi bacterium]|nr:hypothetical protein [Chloroflexota bacterium]